MMSLRLFPLFLFLFVLSSFTLVLSKPTPTNVEGLTNAELMRRGYNPRAPVKFRRNAKGERNGNGKYGGGPRPPRRSATPYATTGRVRVTNPSGQTSYLARDLSPHTTFTLTTDPTLAAIITRPNTPTSSYISLAISTEDAPYLCAIRGFGGDDLGQGDAAYVSLSPGQKTTGPSEDTNNPLGRPSESDIWVIDETTGEITAEWTNDDGDRVPAPIYHDLDWDDLGMTGDAVAYKAMYGDSTERVHFWFEATSSSP